MSSYIKDRYSDNGIVVIPKKRLFTKKNAQKMWKLSNEPRLGSFTNVVSWVVGLLMILM